MTEGTPMRQITTALLGALGCLAATAGQAASPADNYPNRIVKLIVPFPAGGTTDIFARHIGDRLAKAFGHNFVIENRGGAGGKSARTRSRGPIRTATRCSWGPSARTR
jgi:tripartite-type tricarboxylate transporter receptor subunit TctC